MSFRIAVAAAVLLLALPMAPFLIIPLAWPFLAEQLGIHRLHDVGVSALLWLMLVGLLAQLRRPMEQIGGMQQTLLVVTLLLAATAIARPGTLVNPLLLPFGLAFAAAVLHPARREVWRIRAPVDRSIAALGALAAGPLLMYSQQQLRLDASWMPIAAHGGHWTTMAALAAIIPVLTILAATHPRGWRVQLWSAGTAAMLFGVASLSLQHQASSVAPAWSGVAVLWGVVLIVTGELRARATMASAASVA